MVVLEYLWEIFKWIGRRFKSLGRFVVGHEETCVLIVTLLWVIGWSFYQNWKGDKWGTAQEKRIERLEQNHEENITKLTKEYAKIVSGEISGLETRMNSFVERNDGMVLDETVRRIVASHGNIEKRRDDAFKKALDEGSNGGYIFEINQTPGRSGSGVFVTHYIWRPGWADNEGSSSLLTDEEKKSIDLCLDSYFEKEKNEKRKDGFANKDTQRELFHFVLGESIVGDLTEPPEREIKYWTSYREERIKVLTTFAKLGAVIGHIGDKITNYE